MAASSPDLEPDRHAAPEAAEFRPPDLVEEVLGWKVLALADRGHLYHDAAHPHQIVIPNALASPMRTVIWPEREWLRATCSHDADHEPPVESCRCGIYAVDDPRQATSYVWQAPLTVLARVGLAGKIIPGTRGWRGERARVVALSRTGTGPRDYPRLLANVASRYDVPIIDLDFLEHRERRGSGDTPTDEVV